MGAVWEAEDTVLRRQVAVKEVVLPAGLAPEERALSCERTLREARAIARLGHPNVVTLFDVLDEDSRPWVVMELVASRSLADTVKEDGPLPPERVATIGLAILGALEAAHAAGITHRDVKPGNILLGHDGRVKLTDFGIARAVGDDTLTGTGLLVGSPSYIAPEIVRGEGAGPAADLWGLGATMYAAVEGRAPFTGSDAMETLSKVVQEPPAPVDRAGPLTAVLAAMLQKDPQHRAGAIEARRLLLDVLRDGQATDAPGSVPDSWAGTARSAPSGPAAAGGASRRGGTDRSPTGAAGSAGQARPDAPAAPAAPFLADLLVPVAPMGRGVGQWTDRPAREDRPPRTDYAPRPDRPGRSDRPERSDRPGRNDRNDYPAQSNYPGYPAQPDYAARSGAGVEVAGRAGILGGSSSAELTTAAHDVASELTGERPEPGRTGPDEPGDAADHDYPADRASSAADDTAEPDHAASALGAVGAAAEAAGADAGAPADAGPRRPAGTGRVLDLPGRAGSGPRGPVAPEPAADSDDDAFMPSLEDAEVTEVAQHVTEDARRRSGVTTHQSGPPAPRPPTVPEAAPPTRLPTVGSGPVSGTSAFPLGYLRPAGDLPGQASGWGYGHVRPAGSGQAAGSGQPAGSGRPDGPGGRDPDDATTRVVPSYPGEAGQPGQAGRPAAYSGQPSYSGQQPSSGQPPYSGQPSSSIPQDVRERFGLTPLGDGSSTRRSAGASAGGGFDNWMPSAGGTGGQSPAGPGRPARSRRSRTAVSVLVVVLLVAVVLVGGYLAVHGFRTSTTNSGTGRTSAPATASKLTPGAVPPHYRAYTTRSGYTVAVPTGWQEKKQANSIDLQDPNSARFLRFIEPGNGDPKAGLTASETAFQGSNSTYQRQQLRTVTYRNYPAADWEFTFTRGGVLRHVLYRWFVVRGTGHGIYLSAPQSTWADSLRVFTVAMDTVKPN